MSDRVSEKKKERRDDIIRAAGTVFSAKGYAAATVEEIAAAAGVAKGSVYNYFDSKQALFTALFTGIVRQDEEADRERFARGDLSAAEKLSLQMDRWFERFARYEEIGRLVLEFWTTAASQEEGPFTAEFKRIYHDWQERLTAIFREGEEAGEFHLAAGPALSARLLMALFDGIGIQNMLGVGGEFGPEALAGLKDGLFGAIVSGGGNT